MLRKFSTSCLVVSLAPEPGTLLGGSHTTIEMASRVTPVLVAPPLSAPAGHATTHGGAYLVGRRTRPVALSHMGLARAAAVPTRGWAPGVAAAAPVAPGVAAAPGLVAAFGALTAAPVDDLPAVAGFW